MRQRDLERKVRKLSKHFDRRALEILEEAMQLKREMEAIMDEISIA